MKTIEKPKGKPVSPKGEELYWCDDCDKLWREDDLAQAHDVWERITDGYPMSTKECPVCGTLCFPAEGEPIPVPLEPSQAQIALLEKHKFHDLEVVARKGTPLALVCKTCGNEATRTVSEDEIAKPEEEAEETA